MASQGHSLKSRLLYCTPLQAQSITWYIMYPESSRKVFNKNQIIILNKTAL